MSAALAYARSSAALVMNAVSVLVDEMVTAALPKLLSVTARSAAPGPLSCTVVDPVAIFVDEAARTGGPGVGGLLCRGLLF